MEGLNTTDCPLNRHHMDAGNCDSYMQQRRPTLVSNRPKLDSGSVVGALLFCHFT